MAKLYKVDCTDKAWKIWNSICHMWFDYDGASYVTDKAYDLHVDIDILLINGVR